MPARGVRKRRKRRRKRVKPGLRTLAAATGLLLLALAGWLAWPFWQLSNQVTQRTAGQPSRLYGQPRVLEVGQLGGVSSLAADLRELGYREFAGSLSPGQYQTAKDRLNVYLRPFPTPAGRDRGGYLEVTYSRSRISALVWRGAPVGRASLEPPLVAAYLGSDRNEKRPVAVADLPEELVRAVLAAEDSSFFRHAGLSPRGIVRALWVNLRRAELQQGGSTLTQQLVKNLFLTHERNLGRKVREALLALLVDLRYSKTEILEAYLNEIYWGISGETNVIGVGSAAWAYFGKRPRELDLCESALLAGMIRSPGRYSPARHPERAVARRDWVLERMARLEWLEEGRRATVAGSPLCYSPQPLRGRAAPYFLDFAAREASRRFGVSELETSGHALLSTLQPAGQHEAEEAVAWGLEALESSYEKGRDLAGPLQAALVSIDPRTGAVRAYVGGRSYRDSQFDRVSNARRQAGSAFKPVVYTAAFDRRVAMPASFVEDSPVTLTASGRDAWRPQNSDGHFRGWVTAREALERSLNVPTVRVAMATGLEEVVERARDLGISTPLSPVPSLALGAFEVTPIDLATAYATLAAQGTRPPVHGLVAVLDRDGAPVAGDDLPPAEETVSPQVAFVVTSVLQGVLERGTGSASRRLGVTDLVAGKTGTTNDGRDSWFAGYSPDRATLVWVGYDDNSPSRLSGTRAALPIWARFTARVRPAGGYPIFAQPPGVTTALIDPQTGELATGRCPSALTEVFFRGQTPRWACRLHAGYGDWQRADAVEIEAGERVRRRWNWLRRVFGKKNRDRPQP